MKTSLLLGLTLSFFITSAQVEQTDDVESSEIIIETNDTVEFSLDVDEVVEYIDDFRRFNIISLLYLSRGNKKRKGKSEK